MGSRLRVSEIQRDWGGGPDAAAAAAALDAAAAALQTEGYAGAERVRGRMASLVPRTSSGVREFCRDAVDLWTRRMVDIRHPFEGERAGGERGAGPPQ